MYRLCSETDIEEGECRRIDTYNRSILALRTGGDLYFYWNRCPHQGTELDWSPAVFLDPDRRHIQCATHGALFSMTSGLCISGPCKAQSLESVVTYTRDGFVWLA